MAAHWTSRAEGLGWLSGATQAGTRPSQKVTLGPSPLQSRTFSHDVEVRTSTYEFQARQTFRPQLQGQTKLSLEAKARGICIARMMPRGPGSTEEAHSLPPTLQAPPFSQLGAGGVGSPRAEQTRWGMRDRQIARTALWSPSSLHPTRAAGRLGNWRAFPAPSFL